MLNFKEFMAVDPIAAYDEHLATIEDQANKNSDNYAPDIAWGLLNQAEPAPVTPEQVQKREKLKKVLKELMKSFLRNLKTDNY